MLKATDNFYLQKEEPLQSCLLALRQIICKQDKDVTATFKYGMPVFCYKGKMFCYLWVNKKTQQPYLGIVEGKHFNHPLLIIEKRSRMKIILFDADKELPIKTINLILKQAIDLYKTGVVKLK
jgi:Domain of unknown function (DU1801)